MLIEHQIDRMVKEYLMTEADANFMQNIKSLCKSADAVKYEIEMVEKDIWAKAVQK